MRCERRAGFDWAEAISEGSLDSGNLGVGKVGADDPLPNTHKHAIPVGDWCYGVGTHASKFGQNQGIEKHPYKPRAAH